MERNRVDEKTLRLVMSGMNQKERRSFELKSRQAGEQWPGGGTDLYSRNAPFSRVCVCVFVHTVCLVTELWFGTSVGADAGCARICGGCLRCSQMSPPIRGKRCKVRTIMHRYSTPGCWTLRKRASDVSLACIDVAPHKSMSLDVVISCLSFFSLSLLFFTLLSMRIASVTPGAQGSVFWFRVCLVSLLLFQKGGASDDSRGSRRYSPLMVCLSLIESGVGVDPLSCCPQVSRLPHLLHGPLRRLFDPWDACRQPGRHATHPHAEQPVTTTLVSV